MAEHSRLQLSKGWPLAVAAGIAIAIVLLVPTLEWREQERLGVIEYKPEVILWWRAFHCDPSFRILAVCFIVAAAASVRFYSVEKQKVEYFRGVWEKFADPNSILLRPVEAGDQRNEVLLRIPVADAVDEAQLLRPDHTVEVDSCKSTAHDNRYENG